MSVNAHMQIDPTFRVVQGISPRYWPEWESVPSFDETRAPASWFVTFLAGDMAWSMGVMFACRRDAEFAIEFLVKRGITPAMELSFTDEEEAVIIREIIELLPW